MAKSQSHTLGEFIGAFFEDLMKKPIRDFANKNGLFFDTIGPRKARGGRKLTWTDVHGSKHDLDFVLEKGGTEDTIGEPVAFIELAWRRYTKHSKNKAQEISGAVNPICEKYELRKPFKGAILSGQFTDNSLNQLRNDDFHVLYIREEILKTCEPEINQFVSELAASYNRKIKNICILPLHGKRIEVVNVEKAIDFINGYTDLPETYTLEYIEVIVTYNNGTIIQCQFKEKEEAVEFLERIK